MNNWPDEISEYSFDLPDQLIAQAPSVERTDARLLVVRRNPPAGLPRFEHLRVSDLPELVASDAKLKTALWVRNRSRVQRARFYARRPTGSRHEIVLLKKINGTDSQSSGSQWSALVRGQSSFQYPQKLIEEKTGQEFEALAPGILNLSSVPQIDAWLEKAGEVPLPPYIKTRNDSRDRLRYESVWAEGEKKSAAAPTASLHFSSELVAQLEAMGVSFCDVFLHVGLGTFEPVRVAKISEHALHSEEYVVPPESLRLLGASPYRPRLAIGTTALRVLESLGHLQSQGIIPREMPQRGETKLFVKPGYKIGFTDALLTNFHLPQSTLFVLVSVFAGSLTLAKEAYQEAIRREYRFFSYGDATLWI